jgi:threonine/homoserine/homoserine lactone efflux protein
VSTAFLLTTLVIVASPGTSVLYTLGAGLSRGARASVVADECAAAGRGYDRSDAEHRTHLRALTL